MSPKEQLTPLFRERLLRCYPLTQGAFARQVGITRNRYFRIEHQRPNRLGTPTLPTPKERDRIVAALNRYGKRRGLPPVSAEELGLEADPYSDKRGPRFSEEEDPLQASA